MRFRIMEREWSVDNGELTVSLKLKRAFIHEKYKEEIQTLFT
jgi:long-chain acyl-CoA synthetase